MGRTLQKAFQKPQQIAMFMPILEGLDGVNKMSKSLGNYIGVSEAPEVMFKKVMEIPDSLITRYFELVTDEHPDRIQEIMEELSQGRNPRDVKLELAGIITTLYHGEEGKLRGEAYFQTVFHEKELPEEITTFELEEDQEMLLDVVGILIQEKLVASASEFRRLVSQGGVKLNREKVLDIDCAFVDEDNVLQIGKKKFIRFLRRE
jgi:tyrosyl-tRNA synthetase